MNANNKKHISNTVKYVLSFLCFIAVHIALFFVLTWINNASLLIGNISVRIIVSLGLASSLIMWLTTFYQLHLFQNVTDTKIIEKLLSIQGIYWVVLLVFYSMLIYVSRTTNTIYDELKLSMSYILDWQICTITAKKYFI